MNDIMFFNKIMNSVKDTIQRLNELNETDLDVFFHELKEISL